MEGRLVVEENFLDPESICLCRAQTPGMRRSPLWQRPQGDRIFSRSESWRAIACRTVATFATVARRHPRSSDARRFSAVTNSVRPNCAGLSGFTFCNA